MMARLQDGERAQAAAARAGADMRALNLGVPEVLPALANSASPDQDAFENGCPTMPKSGAELELAATVGEVRAWESQGAWEPRDWAKRTPSGAGGAS